MKHSEIINLWPSLSVFAQDIGVEYGTAKAMKRRGSIPSKYWVSVADFAFNRNISGVTFEVLANAVALDEPTVSAPQPEQSA